MFWCFVKIAHGRLCLVSIYARLKKFTDDLCTFTGKLFKDKKQRGILSHNYKIIIHDLGGNNNEI